MKSTKRSASGKPTKKSGGPSGQLVVYIHGIGDHPPAEEIKRDWDLALFGHDMGGRTRMAYWSDILHPDKGSYQARRVRMMSAVEQENDHTLDVDALLAEAGLASNNKKVQPFRDALFRSFGQPGSGPGAKALPLPAFLRKPIARAFLKAFIKDTAAYFFHDAKRKAIKQRLLDVLSDINEPFTLVAHSQGTVVAYEVLSQLRERTGFEVARLVTIGSPLGIQEVQDFLVPDQLVAPANVKSWYNFADPLDPVALDKGIGNDFTPDKFIRDKLIVNANTVAVKGFNPHSALGYLAHPLVRDAVYETARFDRNNRFVVARDVAADMAFTDERRSVLIEILEPGYNPLGMERSKVSDYEKKLEAPTTIADRIQRAAKKLEGVITEANVGLGEKAVKKAISDARIDPLRRFVSAQLTPAEVSLVAREHKDLMVYALWKSTAKKKLIRRSAGPIQVDAARASYNAQGEGITWAVLDTGVNNDHPHFNWKDANGNMHPTVKQVWDCTKPGQPKDITNIPKATKDRDGHGTHVSGIIAGRWQSPAGELMNGMAPSAKLVVYKVLEDSGEGEDAYIIKALDHIAQQNENNAGILIHGVNLSLGGAYDSTVYGCGFTPLCAEMRRLWRAGVLVVVASGNEGQITVKTPDGEVELNSPMSIGDPANLEECIAIGSVNADKPHLYGISAFSSRGPTSDGRMKPDAVAPGERILSCDARYRDQKSLNDLYREDSGTSMAAPHVSGLLAAFLSVRKEFKGRPDEVKALMLRTCIDLKRDRYHQGHGMPNLMRMLLEA